MPRSILHLSSERDRKWGRGRDILQERASPENGYLDVDGYLRSTSWAFLHGLCRLPCWVSMDILCLCHRKLTPNFILRYDRPVTDLPKINAVQFVAYLFLGPETRYLRVGVPHNRTAFQQEYLSFRRLDPAPFRFIEFIQPMFLAKYLTILIPTIAYVCHHHSSWLEECLLTVFSPSYSISPPSSSQSRSLRSFYPNSSSTRNKSVSNSSA